MAGALVMLARWLDGSCWLATVAVHGGALTVAWCGLRDPPVTYVYPDRERGVFRGEKEPAKAVASLLLW